MKSIVVIEDDEHYAEMLAMLLRFKGHLVECARSASEGIKLVKNLEPQLIITDLGLPDMKPLELVRAIVAIARTTGASVVVVSASSEAEMRDDVIKAGAYGYFFKGDDVSKLLAFCD